VIWDFLDRFGHLAPAYAQTHARPKTADDNLHAIFKHYLHVLLGITRGRAQPVQVALPRAVKGPL
jgi:hypothetical protein